MAKGSVILVPFPFDDLYATKVRPAVCLSDAVGPHRHVILAFISSRVPTQLIESDFVLDQADPQAVGTGLKVRSVLRLHRLMTVSESLIRRELGRLPASLQQEVDDRLRRLFGL
jgi:mRNA interferase MazF